MANSLAVDIEIDGATVNCGDLQFHQRGAKVHTTFTYRREYLAHRGGYEIDPVLPMDSQPHTVEALPGAVGDTAPDWWGRHLISRRLRLQAQEEGRAPSVVTDFDFIVGVSDATRQGALRFRNPGAEEYLAVDTAVPRLVDLPVLLDASDRVARNVEQDAGGHAALKLLLAAGSATLGGARPKASISDGGELYIAKFPQPTDDWDVMAWEKTALDLAERAGLEVPRRRLERLDGRGVLLLSRFDRDPSEHPRRLGYASAVTLLGGGSSAGREYLDLAAAIEDFSPAADGDLSDLFRRIAFSVAIHNTDDHMRNIGFLRRNNGWALAPVFDVNPNPELAEPRATTIYGAALPSQEAAGLVKAAEFFRLSPAMADQVVGEVLDATSEWREVAASNGIEERDMPIFETMFTRMDATLRPRRNTSARASTVGRTTSVARGKTSTKSTHGSFKAREREQADLGDLDLA